MAKLLLLDVFKGIHKDAFKVVECNSLDDYYKHLNCECFDIVQRSVAGKMYDIYCDDIATFRENIRVSVANAGNIHATIHNNVIFALHDDEGATVSLEDSDIENIIGSATVVFQGNDAYFGVICDA